MQETERVLKVYGDFAREVFCTIERMEPEIDRLAGEIDSARAIHLYGFGRSGSAALAMAIRLRHFLAPEKQVFWLGDQVRDPVRKDDLAIFFSRSGKRDEVLSHFRNATRKGACCIAVTGSSSSVLARESHQSIILPSLEGGIPYGGGDFELAAWIFQEIFLTAYGRSRGIPDWKVTANHV
ncbi:MAG: SIS domain-containing protein [Methanolinea sp.]|nr:SIS domain-containing protein [Methanolinea sp.]